MNTLYLFTGNYLMYVRTCITIVQQFFIQKYVWKLCTCLKILLEKWRNEERRPQKLFYFNFYIMLKQRYYWHNDSVKSIAIFSNKSKIKTIRSKIRRPRQRELSAQLRSGDTWRWYTGKHVFLFWSASQNFDSDLMKN
jgi:hypothetical protein